MHAFTSLLLALAAATALAAPSAPKFPSPPFDTSECSYDCACSLDNQKSTECCSAIGGGPLHDGLLCADMSYAHASAFITCCGGADAGFFCGNTIGCPVPDDNRQ
ncbi:hypothetical protein QBC40DRAFT_264158 [Triangularia verruculosa]|uniref:Uncharacterized protein n=1 Tax=Triangularia verruculosa TaxID=2587418 RepID=A0AAN7AUB5_9PEZI|nr:hypothetical protein QBC40DRAFT_264158 [Triangularia verruculosa]